MLEVKNLVRVYKPKKGEPVRALDGVSLTFPDRGMIFLLGKSGSGKSTLLNVMGGLDKCDSGEIIIKGKSSADFKQDDFDSYRNTYLGFIFQEYNILPEFNVGVNIGLALQLQGKKATSEEINDILEQVDLQGHGNRKPTELSGGQKQRVAIARALVKSPQIIMADEPTGALDSATGLQVFDTLKKLSKDKLVIVVTHDREFAEQYGDRVIELKDGKVISDISKYQIVAENHDDNLIVSDKVIQVKKGYTLTAEDLTLINKILADDEAIISFDQRLNNGLRANAKIDAKGNRESFKDTDNSKVKSESGDDFKLIKSRLPLKHKFKMGASSLKNKPFRLIVTIFLSLIAFTMFGLADTVSAYDRAKTFTSSFIDSDISYISFTKSVRTKDVFGYYDRDVKMTEDDLVKLSKDTGLDYLPVYSLDNAYFNTVQSSSSPYYKNTFSGICKLNSDIADNFNLNLTGSLPQADNEVVITKYTYQIFSDLGFSDSKQTVNAEDINSEIDFLSLEPLVQIDEKQFKVVGIIDDKFNEERYKALKDMSHFSMDFSFYILMSELDSITTYGPHCLVYANENAVESLVAKASRNSLSISNIGHINFFIGNYYNNFHNITSFDELKKSPFGYIYFGDGDLKDNEIMMPFEYFRYYASDLNFDFTDFDTFVESRKDFYIDKYITENYQSAYDNGFYDFVIDYIANNPDDPIQIDNLTEVEKIDFYKGYLHYYGYHENPYGLSYNQIERSVNKPIMEEYLQANPNVFDSVLSGLTLQYNDYFEYNQETIEGVSIAGIVFDELNYNYYKNPTPYVVPNKIYNRFEKYSKGNIAFAFCPEKQDANTVKMLGKYNYNQPQEGDIFSMKNEVTYILDQVDSILIPLAKAFLYIGLALALFSAVMLMNYISTSIVYKKREIGILRAVGARGSDVFGIFLSESLIIALINFMLSAVLTGVTIAVINTKLRVDYGLLLTFLNFGIRQIALMLVISIAVAFTASFLPVMRIARKKPIDAINNR